VLLDAGRRRRLCWLVSRRLQCADHGPGQMGTPTPPGTACQKPPPGVTDEAGSLLDAMRDFGEAFTARQAGEVRRSGPDVPSLNYGACAAE